MSVDQLLDGGKIVVGISSCLMGDSVRHNGGHKRSRYCMDVLSEYFELRPYCPEVAIGMGVPRESIRLVGEWQAPRALGTRSEALDVTEALQEYADQVAQEASQFSGYILMKDSPSCGLYSTKVYNEKGGVLSPKRAGLFAQRLREHLPLLPMEEEGRLNDPALRENFVARVFVFEKWRRLMADKPTPKGLVDFHSEHKYYTMAHGQALYQTLGRLVAHAGSGEIRALSDEYIERLMLGTLKPPSRKGHVNVMYHLVGYLKTVVPGGIRQDLVQGIEDYRLGVVPLAVPMKLMQHYLDNYSSDYIRSQAYLSPHPYQLGLRNAL